jgi:small subunit ribosomal protein S8
MSFNYPLSDTLTRIRNGQQRHKASVMVTKSKLIAHVLDVMQDEGYIRGYVEAQDEKGHPALRVDLKYNEGEPVIRELRSVSKPGRRVYSSVKTMPRVRNGLGTSIITTPKGVMTDAKARSENVGGEVLCQVF